MPGAQGHPTPLVESAAMAAVTPVKLTYTPLLSDIIIQNGILSAPQLESVIMAGQAHGKTVPAENRDDPDVRAGFMIGDGTGVGKGRQIAAIIMDNWNQGRTKAVWISEKASLLEDARRDWQALGGEPKTVLDHGKVKVALPINADQGILFTTYDLLKAEAKHADSTGKKPTRMEQIMRWLGNEFDGLIALDEAHNMGNATDQAGSRGQKKASKKAMAGLDLQTGLPNSRVVYVSATGATEVANLAYAQRLGLWGRGTAFATRGDFINAMQNGGVAAMELVARDLKAMGRYVARTLSFRGTEQRRLEHVLTPEQSEIYNKLTEAWQIVLQNMHVALGEEMTKAGSKERAAALGQFWGGHQRFFNQVITSLQMPTVIKAMEKDLAAGHAIVGQLVNTNESAQERRLQQRQEDEALEEMDITPREQLMQLLQKSFPVAQYEEFTDENGNARSREVKDSSGATVLNQQAVALRDRLLDQLGSIRVPEGPLDIILNHFGPDRVAEITGRKRRIVNRPDEQGIVHKTLENRPASANLGETASFQDGRKDILVFSAAGGTGRSYHADRSSKSSHKRRVHYLLQPGWRADQAVQGFGRTHRTNQDSAPIYTLVTTNLQGQRRFISSIARRLSQLGALTKGQRQAGDSGMFSSRDNLEGREARDALSQFLSTLSANGIPEIDRDEFQRQTGLSLDRREPVDMGQFLNRLLSMDIEMQNQVFQAFAAHMDQVYEQAAADGSLDVGMENHQNDGATMVSEQTVYTEPESGAKTRHVHLKTRHRNHATSFQEVMQTLKSEKRSNRKFHFAQSPAGRIVAIAEGAERTLPDGKVSRQVVVMDPVHVRYTSADDVDSWQQVPADQAQEAWDHAVATTPEFREQDLHMITGVILPIWDRISGKARVVRVTTDDGKRFLGRVVAMQDLPATLKALGAEKSDSAIIPPGEIAEKIVEENYSAKLANGWRLSRSMVAGEHRIELAGPSWQQEGQLKADGVFSERINWETRYFVPVGVKAATVIERITQGRPVVDFIPPYTPPPGKGKKRFSIQVRNTSLPGSRNTRVESVPSLPNGGQTRARIERVEGAIHPILAQWPNGPKVEIVNQTGELPASLQDEISRSGHQSEQVEAIFDGDTGTIYMVASALDSQTRAQAVLLHEAVAHFGLRTMLGEQGLNTLLDQVARTTGFKKEADAITKERGLDATTPDGRREVAEEYLAKLAEGGIRQGILDRLWSAMRRGLRAIGFNLALTQGDLQELLAQSAENMTRDGKHPQGYAQARPTDSLGETRVPMPETVFRDIGVEPGPVFADYRHLYEKHKIEKDRQGFNSPRDVKEHVESVLSHPTHMLPASNPGYDLLVKRNGNDRAAVVEFTKRGGKYRVVSAYTLTSGQLEVKMRKFGQAVGRGSDIPAGGRHYGEIPPTKELPQGAVAPLQRESPNQVHDNTPDKKSNPKFSLRPTSMSRPLERFDDLTWEQKETAKKFGVDPDGLLVRILKDPKGMASQAVDWFKARAVQGIFDQYHALMKADIEELGKDFKETHFTRSAYFLARQSGTAPEALAEMINYGVIRLDESGSLDVAKKDGPGGQGLIKVLADLGTGEIERFLLWVAGRRGERLKAEGREKWLSDEDITHLSAYNQGEMADGRSRNQAYTRALAGLNTHLNAVMDVAQQSGIIDPESRGIWQSEFYLPFYRVLDEEQQKIQGPVTLGGLVGQYGIKHLHGRNKQVGDLMGNLLMNFNHLLSASLRNRAAKAALERAARLDGAVRIKDAPVQFQPKDGVFHLENGQKVWYQVMDPLYLEAVSAISWEGLRGFHMDAIRVFKRALTFGVTLDPAFRVANLLRDALMATAIQEMSTNPLVNVAAGLKAIREKAPEIARLAAAGAFFHHGHLNANDPKSIERLTHGEILRTLNNPTGWAKFGKAFTKIYEKYQDFGDTAENVNRVAGAMHDIKSGKSLLEAAFNSRDQMDFALTGSWPAIRFLAQTIPFFNARLQGLYKLGRVATDAKSRQRFLTVAGVYVAASVMLYLAFADDERVKDRPEEERDAYHLIPVGDVVFRLPRPFEMGLIATIVERIAEQMVDAQVSGQVFAQRLRHALGETLNLGITPQILKPALEIYANKNAYTGTPIETHAMQNLVPVERVHERTTSTARGTSHILGGALSPVQIDHLAHGYLGWLGATSMALSGAAWDAIASESAKPNPRLDEMPVVGRFVREATSKRTKYEREFYEQLNAAEELMATIRHLRKTGRTDDAMAVRTQHASALAKRGGMAADNERLRDIKARILQVRTSPNLGGDAKRQQLDALYQERNRIVKQAFENITGDSPDTEYQFRDLVFLAREHSNDLVSLRRDNPRAAAHLARTDAVLPYAKAILDADRRVSEIERHVQAAGKATMPEAVRATRIKKMKETAATIMERTNREVRRRMSPS